MKVREESEKARLKLNIKKKKKQNMITGIWPHQFMASIWEKTENSDRLHLGGLQNQERW